MPPAFVLSQDQTLQSNYNIFAYEDLFPSDDFDSSIKFIVLFTTTSSVLQPSKSDSGSSHYSIFQGTRRLPSCKIIPSRGKMIFLFFPAIFLQTLTSQQAGFRGNLLYFLKSTSKISSKGFFKDASLDHSNLFTNICSWRPAGHQGQWSLTYHHFALCQIRFLTFFRFFLRSFSGSFLRSYTKTPPSKNPNSENTLDVCAYISKSIRQPKMT